MVGHDYCQIMSNKKSIAEKLSEIEMKINNNDYSSELKTIRAFGGADVIISDKLTPENKRWIEEQPVVISSQKTAPVKRLVITPYYIELSWLFYQLRDIFNENIDFISKYDFYGILAQNAINFIENNENGYDCKSLLISVLNESRRTIE